MDARKQKVGLEDLEELFDGASRLIVARGKNRQEFDLKAGLPDEELLVKHVLGRSGNLKAPSVRFGKTWLVGWGEPTWDAVFG